MSLLFPSFLPTSCSGRKLVTGGVENELKPLLHTWSLAVEEQYYVLFPIFLMLMWRFKKRWILSSFIFVAFVSLALSHWAAFNLPTANFFLLPTRGWELAIGAGVAFYFLYRKPIMHSLLSHKSIDELLSWSGIGLIGYGVFFFDETTPFPSLYALVPTVGTALIIIFSSKNTLCGKFLGSRIIVGIGLISYSAYLWHQPLFAFARHRSLQEPSYILLGALSVLSLLLAYLSWKYVEAPFRKPGLYSRKQIFSFTAIGSAIFISFGILAQHTDGYKFRINNSLSEMVDKARKKSFSEKLCQQKINSNYGDDDYCVLVPNDRKFAFLYGDSHALALMLESKKAFEKSDHGLLFSATTACPPVKGVYRADNVDKKACYEHNNKVYEYIENNPKIEYVVLSARWTLGMEGTRFNNTEGGVELRRKPHLDIVNNGKYLLHESYEHKDLIEQAYINTIQDLLDANKKVVLIYPIPEVGWNVPDYLINFYFQEPDMVFETTTASTSYKVFKQRNKKTIDALDKIPANQNLFIIEPEKIFCNNFVAGRCITHKDKVIYYRDDNHLSDDGAKIIMNKVIEYL